jgi:hypothetical protein
MQNAGRYSDIGLLSLLRVSANPLRHEASHLDVLVAVANDGRWTMIADDFAYSLWNSPVTRPAIAEIAQRCDVFTCSVGEADHSFDFDYFKDGQLVRRCFLPDPDFKDLIKGNFGPPLPAEPQAFKQKSEIDIILDIASSLGIKTDYTREELRLYVQVIPKH